LFLERVVAAARPVFDGVIAVDRPGAVASAGVIVEEPHEGEGAVFGVVAALKHARADAFVLAVDYPLVTAELLRYLRDEGRTPVWNGMAQSLCAVWRVEMLPVLEQRIAEKRFDLRTVEGREMIPEPELRARFSGEPLLNINTPEEWDRAQRFLASR
jgi:molybdopterin-guanine dinucleotide biosynthesis protein A